MPGREQELMGQSKEFLAAEITRQDKIIKALMDRSERVSGSGFHGSDYNLFQTAITLENRVRERTDALEKALGENEKITRALRESENHFRLIVDHAPISIHEIDLEGRIISMNAAGLKMWGVEDECLVQGTVYKKLIDPADHERITTILKMAYAGEVCHFEFTTGGLRKRLFKSCLVPIWNKNDSVERLMGIAEDITEQKEAEEKIRRMAFYDALTQLPNRRLLDDRMGQVRALSIRTGCSNALMFLDLDNFKPLNDTHGHKVGDLLLVEVATRITRVVRKTDTVARIGGDEFVVLLSTLNPDRKQATQQAGAIAEKIRRALLEPYVLAVHKNSDVSKQERPDSKVRHHCSTSIGVVVFKPHEASQENVLKLADTAMYQAKDSGRNTIRFLDFSNIPWCYIDQNTEDKTDVDKRY